MAAKTTEREDGTVTVTLLCEFRSWIYYQIR